MVHQTIGARMTTKSTNNADISSDFLTVDGVARYLSISKQMVLKLSKNPEENFPKGYGIIKSKNKTKNLYKKEDIIAWVESKKG